MEKFRDYLRFIIITLVYLSWIVYSVDAIYQMFHLGYIYICILAFAGLIMAMVMSIKIVAHFACKTYYGLILFLYLEKFIKTGRF